jgi:tRNA-dihydrouridine synthase A
LNRTLSIAPMMDRTDRHFRYLLRLLSADALLYTEMVVAQAVRHGDRSRLLDFHPAEQPLVLQLGGSDPQELAAAAIIGEQWGYAAVNLNIGCPSDRVQSGQFGACLMAEPQRVAECVRAIRQAIDLPVSIKTRIGIDDHDDYAFLCNFVEAQMEAGCIEFVVHARKAILDGLSPAENRSIPPLCYERVYRLKEDYPQLHITLNGGVRSSAEVKQHLQYVDGVMIGRQAYKEPYWIAELQQQLFAAADGGLPSRAGLVEKMADYAEQALGAGARLHHVTRHMLGLYAGMPGARSWRRFISEGVRDARAGPELLLRSLDCVSDC